MSDVKSVSQRRWTMSLAARIGAGGVLLVAAVMALPRVYAEGMHGPGGPGMGPAMGGPGAMMFGGQPEHLARMVDHMLDGLSASDAQRSQIKQIAIGAAADLKAQADRGRSLRERGMQIFASPNVDASAAEALRQESMSQHDQASRRVLQAMLDISKVLTPEQRAKIGQRMQERQSMMQERMSREHRDRPAKQ